MRMARRPANPGLVIEDNVVAQTSTTIPTVAPAVSSVQGTVGTTITLSDSDTKHRLSIFYTSDGSTPAIFGPGASAGTTQLYTAPFTVPQERRSKLSPRGDKGRTRASFSHFLAMFRAAW